MTSLLDTLYGRKASLWKDIDRLETGIYGNWAGDEAGRLRAKVAILEQVIEQVETVVKALGFKKAELDVSVPGAFRAYYEGGVNEALDLLGKAGEQKT